jgi:hypothetical protein
MIYYYYYFQGKKINNYLFLSMWKLTLGYGIMNWHPGMFLPGLEEKRIYATYFPLVISLMQEDSPSEANNNNNNNNTITRSSFLGYNSNRVLNAPREWLRLPSLDFLPPHVYDVLAGTGGLLLVNGSSQQPTEEQLQQPPNTNTSLPLLQPTSTSAVSCPIH